MLRTMVTFAFATAAALLPIVNPLASAPTFYSLTAHASNATRTRLAMRATLFAVLILIVALFAGEAVLRFFGISLTVLEVAGGLLVSRTGWLMVTGNIAPVQPDESGQDISFVPMALPMLAGPGAIGVTIALSVDHFGSGQYAGAVIGIVIVGLITFTLLHYGGAIVRRMGTRGISAMTTIMGFFVLAIGVAFIAEGVSSLIEARIHGNTIGP